MLLHVLDGTSPDPVGDYKAIQLELELFNPALLDKPQVRAEGPAGTELGCGIRPDTNIVSCPTQQCWISRR